VGSFAITAMLRSLAMAGQYALPFLCLLGAGISAFKRYRARGLHAEAMNRADAVSQMSWREFEVLVGEYFHRQGFVVTNTGGGGPDGGVDVVLQRGSDRYLVQCKHWRALRVGPEPVRELYGLIAAQRMAGGYLVTSGDFTDEARKFVEGRELQLINGKALQRGIQGQASPITPLSAIPEMQASGPACPVCAAVMVKRLARNGPNTGKSFWGCSRFSETNCRGTRAI